MSTVLHLAIERNASDDKMCGSCRLGGIHFGGWYCLGFRSPTRATDDGAQIRIDQCLSAQRIRDAEAEVIAAAEVLVVAIDALVRSPEVLIALRTDARDRALARLDAAVRALREARKP